MVVHGLSAKEKKLTSSCGIKCEKRLIEASGLKSLNALFAEIPVEREHLLQWVDLVADRLGVQDGEATPWKLIER